VVGPPDYDLCATDNASWAAYHASRQENPQIGLTNVSLIPFFHEKSNSVAIISYIMNNNATATQFLNPVQTPVITMDQSLYALAKQWRFPNLYREDKYVIILGGLHSDGFLEDHRRYPWRKWVDRCFNPSRHCKCRYLWRIPSCISCDQNPQGTSGYCCSFILVAA